MRREQRAEGARNYNIIALLLKPFDLFRRRPMVDEAALELPLILPVRRGIWKQVRRTGATEYFVGDQDVPIEFDVNLIGNANGAP